MSPGEARRCRPGHSRTARALRQRDSRNVPLCVRRGGRRGHVDERAALDAGATGREGRPGARRERQAHRRARRRRLGSRPSGERPDSGRTGQGPAAEHGVPVPLPPGRRFQPTGELPHGSCADGGGLGALCDHRRCRRHARRERQAGVQRLPGLRTHGCRSATTSTSTSATRSTRTARSRARSRR